MKTPSSSVWTGNKNSLGPVLRTPYDGLPDGILNLEMAATQEDRILLLWCAGLASTYFTQSMAGASQTLALNFGWSLVLRVELLESKQPGLAQINDAGISGGRTSISALLIPLRSQGWTSLLSVAACWNSTGLAERVWELFWATPLMNIHFVSVWMCGRIWSEACFH